MQGNRLMWSCIISRSSAISGMCVRAGKRLETARCFPYAETTWRITASSDSRSEADTEGNGGHTVNVGLEHARTHASTEKTNTAVS